MNCVKSSCEFEYITKDLMNCYTTIEYYIKNIFKNWNQQKLFGDLDFFHKNQKKFLFYVYFSSGKFYVKEETYADGSQLKNDYKS